MRRRAVAALVAGLAWPVAAIQPATALECTYLAPAEPAAAEIATESPEETSRPGRSGSEGPTAPPTGAERSRARNRADGGPGSGHAPPPVETRAPRLDVDAFVAALDRRLARSTAGYALQLRQHGEPVRNAARHWARRPIDGGVAWDPDQRMHVASISKLITAIALVKLLDDKGIDLDARIVGHLPRHWQTGPGIDRITFAQLLSHESGFDTGTYYADYRFVQRQVAKGVTGTPGTYTYQNVNFALARVLIPILNGDIAADATLSDRAWDEQTLDRYADYVQRVVFAPSGVRGATLVRPPASALAYTYRGTGAGWDSGKLGCTAGAAAWFLSVNEVLDVLGTVRRKGTILSPERAQALLDRKLGIDRIEPVGPVSLYAKSGAWWDGPKTRMEQTVAYVLPEDMELVVFVNSPIGADNDHFLALVTDLYLAHVRYR